MSAAPAPRPITGRRVLAIAIPVVLSNATVPIQGAVDTAIIGNLGSETYLAGVGLGAQMFAIVFVSFNFLHMACSGLTAQALGAGDYRRVMNTLARSCLIALIIAAGLILAQIPLHWAGLAIFEGGAEAERLAGVYFHIRIWGAPAELINYALIGWFAGQELTRNLFRHQLALTLSNIALNVILVIGLGMDVDGVALGTLIASYLGVAYGFWLALGRGRVIAPPGWRIEPARLLRGRELARVMAINADIFVRTLLVAGCFTWMTRLGSLEGDVTLAANVVLWQFFAVSAYALDGFAIAAEALVGQSVGARARASLRRSVVITSLWSGALALVFSLCLLAGGGALVHLFTNVAEVRVEAARFVAWAALTPFVGFMAFQMDGVFTGATGSRQMRNGMILSAAVYFPASVVMADIWGNHGVWAGAHLLLIIRAATLLARYPGLERRMTDGG